MSAFEVTIELVRDFLEDDPSLGTLANQFEVKHIFDMIQNKDQITSENELYEALMDVMYATRPSGPI